MKSLAIAVVTLLVASEGFAGGFSPFELQTAGKRYGYTKAATPDGSRAERFELRAGDCWTDDCRTDRERVEMAEDMPASKLGSDYWYHFSLYVPADWPVTGKVTTKLGQFHQKGSGKPPVLFIADDYNYMFELSDPSKKQSNVMAPERPLISRPIKTLSKMKGGWTNILVQARWSQNADGFIKVWVDGEQKIDHLGANVDRDAGVYFKYGIYRSFVSRNVGQLNPVLVAWYKNINKGRSRLGVEPAK